MSPNQSLACLVVAGLIAACDDEPITGPEPELKPPPGRIAYASHSGPANSLVREVDLATRHDLPLLAPGVSFSPAWSPDGSRLAFLRPGQFGLVTLHHFDPALGEEVLIATLHEEAGELDWAIQETIVFSAIRPGSEVLVVKDAFRIDAAGPPPPRPIIAITRERLSPALSPDGTQVVLSIVDANRGASLWLTNLAGENLRQITTGPYDVSADWSPDGTRIAFARGADSTAQRDIFVMNADGSGLAPVVATASDERDPAWSPDGRWMAFVDGRPGITVMRLDGSRTELLPDVGDVERDLSWRR